MTGTISTAPGTATWGRPDCDAPVEAVDVPGSQGLFDVARRLSERDILTLREVGKLYAQGVLLPQFVGTR